jgi:hypothetical protein
LQVFVQLCIVILTVCDTVMMMIRWKRDPSINIDDLINERQKLHKTLEAMDSLLDALGVDVSQLSEKIPLIFAIKTAAAELKQNITKTTILDALRRSYPHLRANPQSVGAALVKMTQGDAPFLYIEKRGAGNQPTLYTTEPTRIVKLLPIQLRALFAPERARGAGGWQSLFKRLQSRADRETGEIILNREVILAMRHYYLRDDVGGWQNHLKRIFGMHIPEVFRKPQKTDVEGNILDSLYAQIW